MRLVSKIALATFDFNIARCLVQYSQIFSLFLIFCYYFTRLETRVISCKIWEHGKCFPYSTRHRTITNTCSGGIEMELWAKYLCILSHIIFHTWYTSLLFSLDLSFFKKHFLKILGDFIWQFIYIKELIHWFIF